MNIALAGAGIFAREAHLPAIKDVPEWTLKACWSRSEKSVRELEEASKRLGISDVTLYHESGDSSNNLDALLARKDIHVIVMSLPIPGQPDIIRRAWKAGKHVVSEKPVGKDIETAKQLIKEWESEHKPKGVQWIIAEQWPYDTALVRARELMEKQGIGELRSWSMDFLMYNAPDMKYNLTEWRKKPEYQGGYLLDGGVHNFAGIREILGGYKGTRLTEVSAVAQQIQPHLPPHDTLLGITKSNSGLLGNFHLTFGTERVGPPSGVITFRGSQGELSLTMGLDFKAGRRIWKYQLKTKSGENVDEDVPMDGVPQEMKAFAKALIAGPDSEEMKLVQRRSGPKATLKDLEVIEGALQSSEKQQWYSLDA